MKADECSLLRSEQVIARNMSWYHLPVPDGGVPDFRFEQIWVDAGSQLRGPLRARKKILIHPKRGLGKTGTLGDSSDEAVREVHQTRREQEDHVRNCRNMIGREGRHSRARKRGGKR
jgi:hypothetical protein